VFFFFFKDKRVAKSMQSIVQDGLARETHGEVTMSGQSTGRSTGKSHTA